MTSENNSEVIDPQAGGGYLHELLFTASRSSGPGGQNVNKVNSRVTVKWDVAHSRYLSTEQKALVIGKLCAKITKEGLLVLNSQDGRSQFQNRQDVISKLDAMVAKALIPTKPRKKTRPSKAVRRKRLENKKLTSEKKQLRRKL